MASSRLVHAVGTDRGISAVAALGRKTKWLYKEVMAHMIEGSPSPSKNLALCGAGLVEGKLVLAVEEGALTEVALRPTKGERRVVEPAWNDHTRRVLVNGSLARTDIVGPSIVAIFVFFGGISVMVDASTGRMMAPKVIASFEAVDEAAVGQRPGAAGANRSRG
jgi:hypothetical protein